MQHHEERDRVFHSKHVGDKVAQGQEEEANQTNRRTKQFVDQHSLTSLCTNLSHAQVPTTLSIIERLSAIQVAGEHSMDDGRTFQPTSRFPTFLLLHNPTHWGLGIKRTPVPTNGGTTLAHGQDPQWSTVPVLEL